MTDSFRISKPKLFTFPRCPHDDQIDSVSQALGHKGRSLYTDAGLQGFRNLVNALAWDAAFGRLAGRPW